MSAIGALDLPAPPPLQEIARPALFLDLDGTLAAIEPLPQDVKPATWRSHLLEDLCAALQGRLAVVSGRSLDDIDRILEGKVAAVAAVHGLVHRRSDGTVICPSPPPGLEGARRVLADLAAAHPGLTLEDKGLSLALHYRQAPELEDAVIAAVAEAGEAYGLRVQRGDKVAEVVAFSRDKGAAVREFMQEAPFAGGRPIFVGDDLTDEDGFAAARALGGFGVLAGPLRLTRALRRLEDVAAVRGWLETWFAEAPR